MKTPKDYIVFPLDVPDYGQAMGYVETLKESVGLFKVGLELFISQGPKIIDAIRDASSAGIFLDLKLHDIPATVQRAFQAASRHQPAFVTVHCDEGGEILKGVAENNPGNTKILGIRDVGIRDVLHIFIFCLRNGFDYDSCIACQDSHD
jgi:orotidine-5'-phosphate decarboxylase